MSAMPGWQSCASPGFLPMARRLHVAGITSGNTLQMKKPTLPVWPGKGRLSPPRAHGTCLISRFNHFPPVSGVSGAFRCHLHRTVHFNHSVVVDSSHPFNCSCHYWHSRLPSGSRPQAAPQFRSL